MKIITIIFLAIFTTKIGFSIPPLHLSLSYSNPSYHKKLRSNFIQVKQSPLIIQNNYQFNYSLNTYYWKYYPNSIFKKNEKIVLGSTIIGAVIGGFAVGRMSYMEAKNTSKKCSTTSLCLSFTPNQAALMTAPL